MGKGMKAGKKPNPNKGMGGNMQKQMAQMQAMQRKMEELRFFKKKFFLRKKLFCTAQITKTIIIF